MKIAAVSDMHGNLDPIHEILKKENPDLLLCAGDWGTPGEIFQSDFDAIVQKVTTFTVYGNHDNLGLLSKIKNQDGTAILIDNGATKNYHNLVIGGINGIRAKSHKKPWYITDEEVIAAAAKISEKKVDILMTHECPRGIADLTPTGTHGGQRCFTDAFKLVNAKLYICGHLHRKSAYQTKDGKLVVNIGFTQAGDYAVFNFKNESFEFESKVI